MSNDRLFGLRRPFEPACTRALALLGWLFSACLLGCSNLEPVEVAVMKTFGAAYLEIPRAAAVRALMATRHWDAQVVAGFTRAQIVDEGVAGLEHWAYGPSPSRPKPAPSGPTSPGHFLEVLHLSDAQIRDTAILSRSKYEPYDRFRRLRSTLRLELVENLDSLLLSATLRGYRRMSSFYHASRRKAVLAVHTGDLTDLSLVTEIIDAAGAVNHACLANPRGARKPLAPLPFLSAPGNHDGLTFGRIQDEYSLTWELGLNRLEFHLASLELFGDVWPNARVSQNETLSALLEENVCSIDGAPEFSKRVREQFAGERRGSGRDVLRYTPVALKGRINTPRHEDDAFQPGYFSLERNGFRIIVLDTRARQSDLGTVGLVQLGWLYRELLASLRARQPVLIFAHHHPRDFKPDFWPLRGNRARGALIHILSAFPHVLGYFHGHSHAFELEERDGVRFVQAPSLVDFPQGALLVRVELQENASEYCTTVQHVKVRPDRSTRAGRVLDALQDEVLAYAWYDFRHIYGWLDPRKKKAVEDAHKRGLVDEKGELEYGSSYGTSKGSKDYCEPIAWPDSGAAPTPLEALGAGDLVARISDERVRVIGEDRDAWQKATASSHAMPATRRREPR